MNYPVKENKGGNTHVKVSTHYIKGRGIYLDVTPVKVQGHIESFLLFGGESILLEALKRDNKAKTAAWQGKMEHQVAVKAGQAYDLLLSVLNRHGLELA